LFIEFDGFQFYFYKGYMDMAAASTEKIMISKEERDRLRTLSYLREKLFKSCKENNDEFIRSSSS
jgi:hypothetical protein